VNYESIALLSQVVSAFLFIAALVFIWVKYLQPAVLAAQESHNRQIAEAERHRDEAKATLDALQGEIVAAQSDSSAIGARARTQAQREREAALTEARASGERAVRNAAGELDRSREAARKQLREELLEKALGVARSDAAARVNRAVDTGLVTAFINHLERGARN
jgi:F0F1-type ATP synthase membrane subunit b/b'